MTRQPDLVDLLAVTTCADGSFENAFTFDEPDERTGSQMPMYGGLMASLALQAAGKTVAEDRFPHSLRMSFLVAGDSRVPLRFMVHVDRDGGSFSVRRVEATQFGRTVFTATISFQTGCDYERVQHVAAPTVPPPESLEEFPLSRVIGFEARLPIQPFATGIHPNYPLRFWVRPSLELPYGPLLHASVYVYISDVSTGVHPLTGWDQGPGSSLDHNIWFSSPINVNRWLLVDNSPVLIGGGRSLYFGRTFVSDGSLIASVVQEALFRPSKDSG